MWPAMCQARACHIRMPIAITRLNNLAIPPGQSHIRPTCRYPEGVRGQERSSKDDVTREHSTPSASHGSRLLADLLASSVIRLANAVSDTACGGACGLGVRVSESVAVAAYRGDDMEELARFHRELTDTYGYYAQVNAAIGFFRDYLNDLPAGSLSADSPVLFGVGDPNRPDASYQYRRTVSEVAADLSPNGRVRAVHLRSVIVLVVALWEDSYRGRIARELGLRDKNVLKSDVFRDLNKYRQAILHAGGTLREEPRALRIFRLGEQVLLTTEHMEQIFSTVVDELNKIREEHYGQCPKFRFDAPLHGLQT